MSLYAEYISERTDDKIIEIDDVGFITYRHILDKKTTYIIDLYIRPEFRKGKMASNLADQITEEAKSLGHTKLLGSVIPSNKNSDTSIKILHAYGMKLQSCTENFIIFEKEL